jgi:hypothetical protein
MSKDFLGRDLNQGDYVVFIKQGYRELKLAKIKAFSKTGKARVVWNTEYGHRDLLQDGSKLVKVEGPELTALLLMKKD